MCVEEGWMVKCPVEKKKSIGAKEPPKNFYAKKAMCFVSKSFEE